MTSTSDASAGSALGASHRGGPRQPSTARSPSGPCARPASPSRVRHARGRRTCATWLAVKHRHRTSHAAMSTRHRRASLRRGHSRPGCPSVPNRRRRPTGPGPTGHHRRSRKHPSLLELFDAPRAVAELWKSTPPGRPATPELSGPRKFSWRARALADRTAVAPTWPPPRRGIADDLVAEDLTLFSARGIKQVRVRLHLSAVNVRHELILAA